MDYFDLGYSKLFLRTDSEQIVPDTLPSLTEFSLDRIIQEVSGGKIHGGVIESKDGKLQIDLESGIISYTNGVVELFKLGGTDQEMTLKNTSDQVIIDETSAPQ